MQLTTFGFECFCLELAHFISACISLTRADHSAIPVFYGSEWVRVTQSCPTLCYPMDYTVHGILEWAAVPFSRGSSQARVKLRSPVLQVDSLPTELSGKPKRTPNSFWRRVSVLRFLGLQRVRHDWATELNWILCWAGEGDQNTPWSHQELALKRGFLFILGLRPEITGLNLTMYTYFQEKSKVDYSIAGGTLKLWHYCSLKDHLEQG